MIKVRLILLIFVMLQCSCSDQKSHKTVSSNHEQKEELLSQIESLADSLAKEQSAVVDIKKAKKLIDDSRLFVDQYPKDSLAASLLFRAADVSVGIGEYEQSLTIWENMRKQYPNHPKSIEALFFQGFTCDNQLSDKERSANYYKKFLSQYPEHELAPQAKLLLEQLSLSPEELIRRFKENQSN